MEYRVLHGYHYITEPSSHGSSVVKNLALRGTLIFEFLIYPSTVDKCISVIFSLFGCFKKTISYPINYFVVMNKI